MSNETLYPEVFQLSSAARVHVFDKAYKTLYLSSAKLGCYR